MQHDAGWGLVEAACADDWHLHQVLDGLRGSFLRVRRYGRVYRGLYKGKPVAVKVVTDARHVRMVDGEPRRRAAAGSART